MTTTRTNKSKTKVAVIGSGNIGTDLMIKVFQHVAARVTDAMQTNLTALTTSTDKDMK